jgi:hypothetical protein
MAWFCIVWIAGARVEEGETASFVSPTFFNFSHLS